MIEAMTALLLHLFVAALLVVMAAGLLVLGIARAALLLFSWPSRLLARARS